ncbi:hypothetical protein EI171_35670 [Bradyrhizobium sp. LCT2]|uniref:hypothetical protein n=1 Tax=Bradyrhizobium sp. LCT2 TaxID=2493093 RepID=UPI001373CD84|nr:hypothetical protein [Bradyrhizobium sp. LCT2]QHP72176.1 hypothetical protein EI171_35670 [Bradyrhizobium sp. LCT2]
MTESYVICGALGAVCTTFGAVRATFFCGSTCHLSRGGWAHWRDGVSIDMSGAREIKLPNWRVDPMSRRDVTLTVDLAMRTWAPKANDGTFVTVTQGRRRLLTSGSRRSGGAADVRTIRAKVAP